MNSQTTPSDLLSDDEIDVLQCALREWGGPAWCTEEFAVAMGFGNFEGLFTFCNQLNAKLQSDEPLESKEWAQVLLSAEIVFISTVVGSGIDWSTTTGFSDGWTIKIIRSVQRKLSKIVFPIVGSEIGKLPPRS